MSDYSNLIDRLERASAELAKMATSPVPTLYEKDRLVSKREGVELALSYAREMHRMDAA